MPFMPTIEQTIGYLGDPAPNWRWVVALPNLVPQNAPSGYPATLTGLSSTSTAPFGLVHRINFPTRSIESESRYVGGRKYKYPRSVDTGAVGISFYENSQYIITQYLRSWSNLVIDQNNNFAPSSTYKFPIVLYTYDVVHSTTPSMVGTLLGCWPPVVTGYEYTYDSSGPVTLACDFNVDEDTVAVGGGNTMSIDQFGSQFGGGAPPLIG